jgi:hypothetical protein
MPSGSDLERFLRHDGWEYQPKNSRRDKVYTKMLSGGELLRTRVSKGAGEIGNNLFAAILNRQLMVSQEYFNKVLSGRKNSSSHKEDRL